jgi:CRISPR-associated protein Cas2
MDRHFRIIAYDIADDRRRRRLEKLCLRVAARVQYSVFEGWLTDREVAHLLHRARPLVRPPGDSLRVYHLCAGCVGRVDCLGEGGRPRVVPEVIV